LTLGNDLTQAILSDSRTASINEKLQAALGFLERLTLSPNEVGLEDVAGLRAAGVTDQATTDAIYICAGFNIINRVADALGSKIPPPKVFVRDARFLLRSGYIGLSGVRFETKGNSAKEDNSIAGGEARDNLYARKFQQLKGAVLSELGTLDLAVRKAASQAEAIPGVLGLYVKLVAERAYAVTDENIATLRETGYTEDEIFEATASAAVGAGLVRLNSGLTALHPDKILASRKGADPDSRIDSGVPMILPLESSV
jgi:alkylhydroperoxidase family enzyme